MLAEFEEALENHTPYSAFVLIDARITSEIVREHLKNEVGYAIEDEHEHNEKIRPKFEILSDFIENITPEKERLCKNAIKADLLIKKTKGTPWPKTKKDFRDLVSAQNPRIPFLANQTHLIHFIAQSNQSIEFAKILQEAGLDLAPKDNAGNTPLIWSIANASHEFAADFLDLAKARSLDIGIDEADTHFSHNTALHIAVAKGYSDKDSFKKSLKYSSHQIVEKLIEFGANPNIPNEHGLTALDVAAARGDVTLLRLICQSPQLGEQIIERTLDFVRSSDWRDVERNKEILKDASRIFLPPEPEIFNDQTREFLISMLETRLNGQPLATPSATNSEAQRLAKNTSECCVIS